MALRCALRRGLGRGLRLAAPATEVALRSLRPCVGMPVARVLSEGGGSHSDFAPQRKKVTDDASEMMALIEKQVKENDVFLYMKGTPNQPQCGFSAQVVKILSVQGTDFASVNVLDYPLLRESVKEYSSWPTIPQLYVKGEFVGGCDIVTQMHQDGELETLLKEVEALK